MDAPHGQTVFLEGMRVAKEHLDNLQDILALGLLQLRQGAGLGKVVYGFKVEASDGGKIKVGEGLAFDDFGRPLYLKETQELPLAAAPTLYAVAAHQLQASQLVRGLPTILTDGIKLELRTAPPPYADGGVRFAEINPGSVTPAPAPTVAPPIAVPPTPIAIDKPILVGPPVEGGPPILPPVPAASVPVITQSGDWFLPPLYHGHSGKFFTDAQSHLRYDGHPLGFAGPLYDSGFVHMAPGATVHLRHGLPGRDFLAQLEARRNDGSITNHGSGNDYWYELPGDGMATLSRSRAKLYSDIRLRLWPFGSPGTAPQGPVLPIADAGADKIEELGVSFNLDGTQSHSPIGAALKKFKWTQLS